MKFISQFVQFNFVIFFFTFSSIAQTDSINSKVVELQKAFQETVKKYEAFEAEHGHYIQTPNVKMHYLTWGKPTGIPLVWVHGTTSNCYEASLFADSLVKNGFYVIAIDYYGHGKTPFPTKEVSIHNIADDIKYLLNKLKIKKTIIGGWSRGGSIATAFYDAYSTMVLGIVLEDGGSVGWTRPYYKLERQEMLKKLNALSEKYGPIPSQKMYSSLFDAFCRYQPDGKIWLRTFHSVNKSSAGQWAWNPDLDKWLGEDSWESITKNTLRPTEAPLFEYSTMMLEPKIAFRNLQVPLLIFDPIDSTDVFKDFEEDNRLLTQQHPKWVTYLVYENTGHGVKYQHPERFYKDLISFLDRIKLQASNSHIKK
jgi:pimeloyl-ACP methyl ester carboxylesterase